MPIIPTQKQSFGDPFELPLYEQVVAPDQEWGDINGLGVPEPLANVTGDHLFLQADQPTPEEGAKDGDVWYDTSDDNHPYKLVDKVWTSIRDNGAGGATPGTGKWSHNIVFSVTDYNTVAWGTGTITIPDGTNYSIVAGDTGNMAAVTYIFLDVSVSATVLQVTTTSANSVGANRILVAVAKQNADTTKDAEFQVFGGFGQNTFITADNIAASTITGDEIAANTITAGKLSVSSLSAITADLGTITAGTITLNSSGYIRSGQTDYDTGTGFFLGLSGGVTKFSIGDSAGSKMTWNGDTLEVSGTVIGADVTRAMWVHCYGANQGTSGTNRTTAGTQPATGYSDAATKTILIHQNGTNGTRWWKLLYEDVGLTPYFAESSSDSTDSDGGSIAIGTDEWWADSTNIYKNGSAVTISGTAPSADPVLGHDPTNSYLLVQDSSTRIRRYSGISGTTITNINSNITLDNAVDTDKGFIYDDTNAQYIFVDGTVLRRFNSSGTTIDTVTFPEVSSGVVISGICFINDRVYLITGYGHIEFQDDTTGKRDIFDAQFIPTSMTR